MITSLLCALSLASPTGTMSGTSDTAFTTKPFYAKEWKLVWSDEFNGKDGVNPKDWIYDEGRGQNREVQYYTRDRRENVVQKDGKLLITARKEAFQGADFTSGRLTTSGKRSFLYGRIEAYARVPKGRGTWPAVWLLGETFPKVGWPACGEIDILEYVGMDPFRVHANIHVEAYNHLKNNGKGKSIRIRNAHEEFHLFAVEWYKDRLEFFLDDVRYLVYRKERDDLKVWPFDQPHFLILNLAVGGDWGGQRGIDESLFPHTFEVDYVRYYKRKDQN
jgi:beta-glucanase (GH16 family)